MTTRQPSPLEGQIQRLDQTPLRDRVHSQLEELITSGAFPAGSKLVEGEIAGLLGVSRGPVRETLQILSRDGFVDLRPRQGAFVHSPTEKEVDHFYEVRRALECESARLAALRINDDGRLRLSRLLEDATKLLEKGEDPSALNRIQIHQEITQLAGNPLLDGMLKDLNKRWTWYLSPFDPTLRRRAWDEHRVIVEDIAAGDADRAVRAMGEHIERSHANYVALSRGEVSQ
ncbi:MAG: GntR family transcriptional regulator [Marmoricola sp.]|jgi:DNA-binding GntR family transcriptional regulator|nr:GntR family transcriptional regulator [Marmoricola sp.]